MTGHTLTKITTENDTSVLALQPGFKIAKSVERKAINDSGTIAMDDTLTTPIQETELGHELFYI